MTSTDERRKRYETAIGATDIHNAHVIRLAAHAAMAVADAEQQALRVELDHTRAELAQRNWDATRQAQADAVRQEALTRLRALLDAEREDNPRQQPTEQVFPIATHAYQGAGFLSPCTATGYGNTCGQASHDHDDEGHTCHTATAGP